MLGILSFYPLFGCKITLKQAGSEVCPAQHCFGKLSKMIIYQPADPTHYVLYLYLWLQETSKKLNPIQGGGGKNTCTPLFHQLTVGGQK